VHQGFERTFGTQATRVGSMVIMKNRKTFN